MKEEKTLDSILDGMEKAVAEDIPVSPVQWVDGAIKINALKGTLDNEIAEFEGKMAIIEADYVKDGEPAAKAKILSKSDVDYVEYLKAKAKEKRIVEFVRLSKKRSMIEEF